MKMIITFTAFLFLFLLSNVNASLLGGMGSGGGKALICFNSVLVADQVKSLDGVIPTELLKEISSMETLDLYYTKSIIEPSRIMSANAGENYHQFFNRIMGKILAADPFFAHDILKSRKTLNDRVVSFKNAPVEPTDDDNYRELVFQEECTLTNIAIQKWDAAANGFRLHIDMRLFNHIKFSEESKATLLMHEYLYFIARNKGERDSRSTRVLVSGILGVEDSSTLKEYIDEFLYK